MRSIVKNPKLAAEGKKELAWARANMPILARIRARFQKEKPLKGLTIGVCLHLEKKTGILLETLAAGGAAVAAASCNPLTTDDRVAAALALHPRIAVFAWAGQTSKQYYDNISRVLDFHPSIVIDDGMDQISLLHTKRRDALPGMIGGCEETTTGVIRLQAMHAAGKLAFPVYAVNNAYSKFLFDNRFGTGQSTVDAVMRATNKLIAGKTAVVVGFGSCGRGIAERLRGLGANVIVVEAAGRRAEGSPSGYHKALEALYSGFRVMPLEEAAPQGDLFITATGDKHVITGKHFARMKDGALLANAGHFNIEIDEPSLRRMSRRVDEVKENVACYTLKDGRRLYLLSEGRLVNLARPSGQGHPIEIMDGSFAIQALCAERLATGERQKPGVLDVPNWIDDEVARLALESQGVTLKPLTREQERYLREWREGT
ncbi:MAG: adenosylhomocysteinase [Candidatus Micrarchaeia archaeon]